MMSFGERVGKFLNRNVVLITGIGIIVSTHWGWSRLQHNPVLVPEDKRRELPILIGAKALEQHIVDKIESLKGVAPDDTDKPS